MSGVERAERKPGDLARDIGNVVLFVPRNVIDLIFKGTSAAAELIADKQLVPRYRDLMGAPGGDIFVFPTLFAETGSAASIGLRMVSDSRYVTTSQRFGYGGPSDIEVESRVVFKGLRKLPYVISLEAYYKLEDDLEYYGIGIRPHRDERNAFRSAADHGLYTERHVRGLGSLGLRLAENYELMMSLSLARRQVWDTEEAGPEGLSAVFEPDSVPGLGSNSFIAYGELAARFDSRKSRSKPSPGVMLEAYTGGARSVQGDDAAFMRIGWRAAAAISVYRRTNILMARAVFDRLIPLGGLPVPFNELPRQPDFRGFDIRRDYLSMVGSIDYSWMLVPFMGMRVFADIASAAPGVAELELDHIKHLRLAAGWGMDFFSNTSSLARFALSTSPEGVRVLLSIGVPEAYGDRQHRD